MEEMAQTAKKKPAPTETNPRYTTFVSKGARLTRDQINALNDLARDLGINRQDKSERITANTLIRIAIDYLLANKDVFEAIEGENEHQLLANFMQAIDNR